MTPKEFFEKKKSLENGFESGFFEMPSVRINNIKQYKAYIICKNRKKNKKSC